jgi:hypothetical protein
MSETFTKEEITVAKAAALNRYDPQFEHFCNRCGKTIGFDGFVYCKYCGRELLVEHEADVRREYQPD